MFDTHSKSFLAVCLAVLLTACGGSGGGGEGGDEGGSEGGGEGSGHEGGGEGDSGANVPFVSSGQSRGIFESLILMPDEAYAGLLNDTEIAISYDPGNGRFVGRLRNEATEAVCDVRASVELDGFQIVNRTPAGNAHALDGLRPYDRADFEFPLSQGTTFSEWVVMIETSTCSSAPAGTGGGGEGSEGGEDGGEGPGEHGGGGEGGSEGGGEGGNEGGGEGSGHDDGSGEGGEDDPTIPIAEVAFGTFGTSEYSFMFDMTDLSFRGTVHNPTGQVICGSKTEIHMGIGGTEVVELGPTIPADLSPGETATVVMTAPAYLPDTYAVHPESSACP